MSIPKMISFWACFMCLFPGLIGNSRVMASASCASSRFDVKVMRVLVEAVSCVVPVTGDIVAV